MNKRLLLGFLALAAVNTASAEVKMVPLDLALGYWETNAEILESDALTKMLQSVPEAQRETMREMMASGMKIPPTMQCITADSFKDMEKQMRESLGDQATGMECKFDIASSSSKAFSGKLKCTNMEANIQTKVINSKLQESVLESNVAGIGGTKLKMTAQWKSETCPEGTQ